MKKLVTILVVMLFCVAICNPVSSLNKVQVGDEWQYESGGEVFNETSSDVYIWNSISVTDITSDRPFPYQAYQYYNNDISINITAGAGAIVATQEGIVPLFHKKTLDGYINITMNETPLILNVNASFAPSFLWEASDDPSNIFTTGSSVTYILTQLWQFGMTGEFSFKTEYVISSLNDVNYTVQIEKDEFRYTDGLNEYTFDLLLPPLSLLELQQVNTRAFQLDYNSESQPIRIIQSEPIRVVSDALSLQQASYNSVEYNLVGYDGQTSTNDDSSENSDNTRTSDVPYGNFILVIILPTIFWSIIYSKIRSSIIS